MRETNVVMAMGVPVVHEPEDAAAARAIAEAVVRTASDVLPRWGLAIPQDCQVHVMTSWERFVDDTVPPRHRWWVRATKPLWARRAERTFAVAGGWMLPWRGRLAVGVKPPRVLPPPTPMGARLFKPVPDALEKVQHLTCHEFTHACTAHLRLPAWLNEGLAVRAVDVFAHYETVRDDTRELVVRELSSLHGRAYRRVRAGDEKSLLELYATGYWITRRIDEQNPRLLRDLLRCRRSARELARMVRVYV